MGSEGYFQGKFQGRYYRAHRIIWRLQTGESPDVIDHINGDRTDNRWANLRNVSWIENARNSAAPSCNLSGVAGVSFNRRHSSWRAYITVDRRLIHLGTFKEKAAAIAARRVAEVKHGFHVNHGRVAACA